MNIFGFTIIRTSKAKREAADLERFKTCVKRLDKCCSDIIDTTEKLTFSRETFTRIANLCETFASLTDIYITSEFSMPSGAFNISNLRDRVKRDIAELMVFFDIKNGWDSAASALCEFKQSDTGVDCSAWETQLEEQKQRIISEMSSILRRLDDDLLAVRICIKHDLMRIECDVDILSEYHKAKNLKKLPKTVFSVHFRYLSNQEIDMQRRKNDDAKRCNVASSNGASKH